MEALAPVRPLAPLVVPRDFQDAVHAWRTERPKWARLEEHVQAYIQIYEDEGLLWADDPPFLVSANPVPAAWGEPSLDAPWSPPPPAPPPPPPPPPSPPPEWQDADLWAGSFSRRIAETRGDCLNLRHISDDAEAAELFRKVFSIVGLAILDPPTEEEAQEDYRRHAEFRAGRYAFWCSAERAISVVTDNGDAFNDLIQG
jgi:hypothetical protein